MKWLEMHNLTILQKMHSVLWRYGAVCKMLCDCTTERCVPSVGTS